MGKKPSGKRHIGGELFHDTGYHGQAAKKKQKYYQEQGAKTRLIKVSGTTVLFTKSGRKRKR